MACRIRAFQGMSLKSDFLGPLASGRRVVQIIVIEIFPLLIDAKRLINFSAKNYCVLLCRKMLPVKKRRSPSVV